MLFNGGLVPTYLLISKYLGMRDNIWVLIIPSLFNAWNMFLMRNFLKSIPNELIESSYIDGANDVQILFKITLPLAVPGIQQSVYFMRWDIGINGTMQCFT